METIIKGGNLMLFITDDATSIPLATSHTLRISAETTDVSNKDVASGKWGAQEVSKFSWEVTTDNLMSNNGVNQLYGLMLAGTPIDAFFFEKNEADGTALPESGSWTPNETNKGFTGKVIITSLEITAQNGENATFSATFTGYGRLIRNVFGETTCASPTISPASWASGASLSVTMSCSTIGSSIYYTTDGTTPTSASTLYTGAITLSATTTVKAIAIADGYDDSTVATKSYTKPGA